MPSETYGLIHPFARRSPEIGLHRQSLLLQSVYIAVYIAEDLSIDWCRNL